MLITKYIHICSHSTAYGNVVTCQFVRLTVHKPLLDLDAITHIYTHLYIYIYVKQQSEQLLLSFHIYLYNVFHIAPLQSINMVFNWCFKTIFMDFLNFFNGYSRIKLGNFKTFLKGSDRLCKVVELSMQCCGKLLSDSFETYKTF